MIFNPDHATENLGTKYLIFDTQKYVNSMATNGLILWKKKLTTENISLSADV